MAYSKAEFRILREKFQKTLIDQNNEPLSCALYDAPSLHGSLVVQHDNGVPEHYHVAEACNIAAVISSIGRILSLPRSEVACEEMSEILILRLDVLREYIRATLETAHKASFSETDPDKMIKRWAGFLKHPFDYVFAHRCLPSDGVSYDPPAIEIDCAFLTSWDSLKQRERDRKKTDFKNQIVTVKLPEVSKLEAFFMSSADHINKLIAANTLQRQLLS